VLNINKNQIQSLILTIKASIVFVKVPFKESKIGRMEIIFAGDAIIPDRDGSHTQFLDCIE
jgi:hypothetical protein